MSRLLITIAAVSVVLLPAGWAECHPVHFSFAELEWNSESRCIEVSLQMEPEDLQAALRLESGDRQLSLESPEIDEFIRNYVSSQVVLASTSDVQADTRREYPVRWVGSEITLKAAWAYFEVPMDTLPDKVRVTNRVLFEVAEEQINVINFRYGDRRRSARLNAKIPSIDLTTNDS